MSQDGGNSVPRITKAEHIGPDDTGDNIEAKRVAVYEWNGTNWERSGGGSSSSSSVTSVGDSATNTELLASNTSRKEAVITNDSSAILYVAFGETASSTNYTARLEQYGYVRTQYKGQINGIWASDAGGSARITELT